MLNVSSVTTPMDCRILNYHPLLLQLCRTLGLLPIPCSHTTRVSDISCFWASLQVFTWPLHLLKVCKFDPTLDFFIGILFSVYATISKAPASTASPSRHLHPCKYMVATTVTGPHVPSRVIPRVATSFPPLRANVRAPEKSVYHGCLYMSHAIRRHAWHPTGCGLGLSPSSVHIPSPHLTPGQYLRS